MWGCPAGAYVSQNLLEEWLAYIPDFSINSDTRIRFDGGLTIAVSERPLQWTLLS
jgi:hypothetical protein